VRVYNEEIIRSCGSNNNFRHRWVRKDDLAYCGGQQLDKTGEAKTRKDLRLLAGAHPLRVSSRASNAPCGHAMLFTI